MKNGQRTISDLSRVKNDTSLPPSNNATILDMVNDEDDGGDLFDDVNGINDDDASVTSHVPQNDHGISPNAMYEPADFHDINGSDENKNPTIRREKQKFYFNC